MLLLYLHKAMVPIFFYLTVSVFLYYAGMKYLLCG